MPVADQTTELKDSADSGSIAGRFRGFLPVVVDLETGGFDPVRNPILELAAFILHMNENGELAQHSCILRRIKPFPGSHIDPAALAFNRIDPADPARLPVDEAQGLKEVLQVVRKAVRESGCTRAILVGHNPNFDLRFLHTAIQRNHIKRDPFHPFSTFDTATLGGLAYGQTVLARAVAAAGITWDENRAHSALYDAERTATLFCTIVNRWRELSGSQVG